MIAHLPFFLCWPLSPNLLAVCLYFVAFCSAFLMCVFAPGVLPPSIQDCDGSQLVTIINQTHKIMRNCGCLVIKYRPYLVSVRRTTFNNSITRLMYLLFSISPKGDSLTLTNANDMKEPAEFSIYCS